MVAFLHFLRSSWLKEESWQHSTPLLNLRVIREMIVKNKKAPDQANTVTEVHSDSELAVATSCFFAADY